MLGKGDARAEANLPAYNAVAAKEALFLREEVHRAALALGAAGGLAIKLGHALIGRDAFSDGQAVVAVGGNHVVVVADGRHAACRHGFLADVEVAKARESSACHKADRPFLQSGAAGA